MLDIKIIEAFSPKCNLDHIAYVLMIVVIFKINNSNCSFVPSLTLGFFPSKFPSSIFLYLRSYYLVVLHYVQIMISILEKLLPFFLSMRSIKIMKPQRTQGHEGRSGKWPRSSEFPMRKDSGGFRGCGEQALEKSESTERAFLRGGWREEPGKPTQTCRWASTLSWRPVGWMGLSVWQVRSEAPRYPGRVATSIDSLNSG